MQHNIKKYLYDIKESILSIDDYLGEEKILKNLELTMFKLKL